MKHFTHKPFKSEDGHDHGHDHGYKHMAKKRLILSMVITGIVMIVEIVGGILSNSMALLSDAGHMFTHMFALGISLAAIYIASRDPRNHRTFGLYRVEILAALFNSLFLFGVTVLIVWESIERLMHAQEVAAMQMLLVAIVGLVVNIVSIMLLYRSAGDDINIKAAFIHVIADAASSVGVVAGALVIHFNPGWSLVDPILAIGIALIIVVWAFGLFKDSVNVLLETAPKGMDVDTLHDELKGEIPEICEIYDMHIWVITTNMYMFSAHIALERKYIQQVNEIRDKINTWLKVKHDIDHTTVEFDIEEECVDPEKHGHE
ncbi:cation diffusion facilitator family transporter [Planctomycetota bacterium]